MHSTHATTLQHPGSTQIRSGPVFTPRRVLTNVKGKDEPEDRPGALRLKDQMLRLSGHLYR